MLRVDLERGQLSRLRVATSSGHSARRGATDDSSTRGRLAAPRRAIARIGSRGRGGASRRRRSRPSPRMLRAAARPPARRSPRRSAPGPRRRARTRARPRRPRATSACRWRRGRLARRRARRAPRRAASSRATARRRSARAASPSSPRKTAATSSGGARAWRCTQFARDVQPTADEPRRPLRARRESSSTRSHGWRTRAPGRRSPPARTAQGHRWRRGAARGSSRSRACARAARRSPARPVRARAPRRTRSSTGDPTPAQRSPKKRNPPGCGPPGVSLVCALTHLGRLAGGHESAAHSRPPAFCVALARPLRPTWRPAWRQG